MVVQSSENIWREGAGDGGCVPQGAGLAQEACGKSSGFCDKPYFKSNRKVKGGEVNALAEMIFVGA